MKPRLIGICFNVYGTGLTRVMHTVMRPLAEHYEVHYLGIGYSGPVVEDGGLRIHPTNPRGGDVFAAFQARDMVRRLDPAIVFVLHDIWHFRNYTRVFEPVRDRARFVGYMPLDGNIVDEGIARPLHGLDRAVVYTDWAKDQLEAAFGRLRDAGETAALPPVEVVFHGVDVELFHPDPELEQAGYDHRGRLPAKRRVFPQVPDLEDSFIVLNASRPAIRKRVDLTVEGFARFARGKPANVRLCLHQAITEDDTEELLRLATARGIGDRLLYNPVRPEGGAISEAELRGLYAACDIGVNTSMGEGWGLVSFEHAAAGGAQIIPRHSACGALWNRQTAWMLEPAGRGIPPFSPLEMQHVDAGDVAAAFEALYQDRTRLRRLARAGHDYVFQPEFRWQPIVAQWRTIFQEVAGV